MAISESPERCRRLYEAHCLNGETLQSLGDKEGVTRERIRQLVNRYKRHYRWRDDFNKGVYKPVVMGDIRPLCANRVRTLITRCGLESYPIQSFVDKIDLRELVSFPGVGAKTVENLIDIIGEAGYDVSHFRAPWNGKNHNTLEYVRRSAQRWGEAVGDSLPSLYTQSGEGSEGAGLPEI